MTDIAERLRLTAPLDFGDSDVLFEAADEIERLQKLLLDACEVFEYYDLPEHALHYRRKLQAVADDYRLSVNEMKLPV